MSCSVTFRVSICTCAEASTARPSCSEGLKITGMIATVDDTNILEAELLTHKSLEERSLGVRCSDAAPTFCSLTITVGFPIVNCDLHLRISDSFCIPEIYYRKSNSNGK